MKRLLTKFTWPLQTPAAAANVSRILAAPLKMHLLFIITGKESRWQLTERKTKSSQDFRAVRRNGRNRSNRRDDREAQLNGH